jgi:copper chaperone
MHVLQVGEMSCGHCVGTVTRAIQQLDSTAQVNVDLATGTVRVQSSASLPQIVRAIEEAGYPVKTPRT